MTAAADATGLPSDHAKLCPALDPSALAAANINPVTGLSTDYLNHFNEAVMLIELIPSMPECRDDLVAWRPATYHEHFAGSHLRHRELAIAAYGLAEPLMRGEFDDLCQTMTGTILAVREALSANISAAATAAISEQAAAWLKPLIARTSAVIHGLDVSRGETISIQQSQAAVDALLEP